MVAPTDPVQLCRIRHSLIRIILLEIRMPDQNERQSSLRTHPVRFTASDNLINRNENSDTVRSVP